MNKRISYEDLSYIALKGGDMWDQLRGKNIFITGGTGFFGKWLLESFIYINQQMNLRASITVLSRNPQAFILQNPQFNCPEIKFIKGDVRDFELPKEKFQYILHCATAADTLINNEQPLEMLDTITLGTRRILDFALQQPLEALLFTSSGAVYGKQPSNIPHISETDFFKIDINNPKSAYAEGKRIGELYCATYFEKFGLPVKIARCFAFVGPYLPLDKHFAIGNFIDSAIKNQVIIIKGDGSTVRSYMYASDLTICLWTILLKGRCNSPYNVGSEEAMNMKQIAVLISNYKNKSLAIKIIGKPIPIEEVDVYVPKAKKISELDIKTTVSLEEAIEKTIKFHETV